ncbi:hypothetical protein ACHHYP_13251 [Achlya hypogyna]|uniref:NAD(+) ADP-ribosyltransferase n=1 Tax=Achlya hypogyna TaxID=1202772 RepID=A0A1V9YFM1_ACHHY|nr:hypothetical protein ACHHYP_13251 [Achlya hypogyna]
MTSAGVSDDSAPAPKKAKKASAPPKPIPKLLYGQIDPIARDALSKDDTVTLALMIGADGARVDASLALVDIPTNTDKYYLLQAIQAGESYHVFARWGRTGTAGQSKLDGPFTAVEAQAAFDAKFLDKTGNTWATRAAFAAQAGKYDLLHVDYGAKNGGEWEYYMDDHIDDKPTGWHPYTEEGCNQTEMLWSTFQSNQSYQQRIVISGYFSYLVDLVHMTQTNVKTQKQRHIRRTFNGIVTASAAAHALPVPQVAATDAMTTATATDATDDATATETH